MQSTNTKEYCTSTSINYKKSNTLRYQTNPLTIDKRSKAPVDISESIVGRDPWEIACEKRQLSYEIPKIGTEHNPNQSTIQQTRTTTGSALLVLQKRSININTDLMGGKKSPPAHSEPAPAPAVDNQQVALITAQIMQQLQQQQPAAAATGVMTPETLQAIASLVSSSASGKSLLPNTAPVSSLLPPLPGMNAATQAAMTSQIASIIAQATPQAHHQQQPDPAAIAAAAQHLAAAAAAAAAAQQHSKPPPLPTAHLLRQPPASAPLSSGLIPTNMQSWSLEQLRKYWNTVACE